MAMDRAITPAELLKASSKAVRDALGMLADISAHDPLFANYAARAAKDLLSIATDLTRTALALAAMQQEDEKRAEAAKGTAS